MNKAKEYKEQLEAEYQRFKNQTQNGFAQELRGLAQSFNTRALKAFIEGC